MCVTNADFDVRGAPLLQGRLVDGGAGRVGGVGRGGPAGGHGAVAANRGGRAVRAPRRGRRCVASGARSRSVC